MNVLTLLWRSQPVQSTKANPCPALMWCWLQAHVSLIRGSQGQWQQHQSCSHKTQLLTSAMGPVNVHQPSRLLLYFPSLFSFSPLPFLFLSLPHLSLSLSSLFSGPEFRAECVKLRKDDVSQASSVGVGWRDKGVDGWKGGDRTEGAFWMSYVPPQDPSEKRTRAQSSAATERRTWNRKYHAGFSEGTLGPEPEYKQASKSLCSY